MEWLIPIIICLLVGMVLLIVEVFMPGFGIPGISGSILLIAGVVLTWMKFGAKVGLGMTVAVLAVMGIILSISMKSVKSGKLSRSELTLEGTVNDGNKIEKEEMQQLIGLEGKTLTALRPVGAAEFACGKLNVQSDSEFIEKDVKVRIEYILGTSIYVKRI